MADIKKISDVKPGDYPAEAYHDPNTGMYTMPEHQEPSGTGDFQEHKVAGDKSMWLPQPHFKPIRLIQFAQPHAWLEVMESIDHVIAQIDIARTQNEPDWFWFVEPVYGKPMAVPRAKLAEACWVMEGFKDMEQVKLQMEAADASKRQMRMQLMGSKKGLGIN